MVVDRLGNGRTQAVGRSSSGSKKPSLSSLLACLFALTFSLFLIGLAFQFIAIHRIHNEDNSNNNKISQLAVDVKTTKKTKKPTIAYLVTITGCGEKRTGPELAANLITQGAAVLKHSIHLAHNNNNSNSSDSSSKYDYQMYAIIHPTAKSCAITPMKKLGYKVLLRNTPFDKSDILMVQVVVGPRNF